MKSGLLILLSIFMIGCVSNPTYDYDPNEKIINGKVLNKETMIDPDALKDAKLAASIERNEYINQQATIVGAGPAETAAAIIILNMLDITPPGGYQVRANPIVYLVESNNQQLYKIFSYHSGFSTGDCVRLFISGNPDKYPPRMAYGGECS